MKTLGFTKAILLPLMILGTIMGSSIASPTPSMGNPISVESTSCRSENQKEQSEESQVNQTGRSTMEALTNLNKTLEKLVEIISKEKS